MTCQQKRIIIVEFDAFPFISFLLTCLGFIFADFFLIRKDHEMQILTSSKWIVKID
jgi:hypothetical protein